MGTLPFFWATIRAPLHCLGPHEKRVKGYPDSPKTLGEHLRKRRLDLGETQEQAASRFGVTFTSYNGWEADRIAPKVWHWPKVIEFLGHDPNPAPTTFDEALTSLQRRHGLPREMLAVRIGIERKTLFNWIAGRTEPCQKAIRQIIHSQIDGIDLLLPLLESWDRAKKSQ